MRYLMIPVIAAVVIGCSQYECCDQPCDQPCRADYCADEKADEPSIATVEEMSAAFGNKMKEMVGVAPLLTTTNTPPSGVSTMISINEAMDIKKARQIIMDTAETLLTTANDTVFIRENAKNYPLTTSDLDIMIDTTSNDTTIRSVSLIRGVIEYEVLDEETNTCKIIKQEPITHAQARTATTNCCGSYFVSTK